MANVSLKQYPKNTKKVSISCSSFTLKPSSLLVVDGVSTAGTLVNGDVVTLCTLPKNVDVTNAYIYVKTAPTGGTQTLQLKLGSTEIVAAVALGTVSNTFKGTAVKVNSGSTGGDITATLGVANLTDGEIRIVIEYNEYTKVTGELLN